MSTHIWIQQRHQARFQRLFMTFPMLMVIRQGVKQVRLSNNNLLQIHPGHALAVSGGETIDVWNIPPENGPYRAEIFAFSENVIPASGKEGIPERSGMIKLVPEMEEVATAFRETLETADTIPADITEHRARELVLWIKHAGITLTRAPATVANLTRVLIDTDPGREWSTQDVLDGLAKHKQAMSEATLRRKLSDAETSITEIISESRIALALTLLQSQQESITRVASTCGFSSPSRFAAKFKERFGILPSHFRNRS